MLFLALLFCVDFFFFKQKTAYEMRISDWSSDVCSSDLRGCGAVQMARRRILSRPRREVQPDDQLSRPPAADQPGRQRLFRGHPNRDGAICGVRRSELRYPAQPHSDRRRPAVEGERSEEHTSELQSLMRNSYAVFCLK